MEKRNALFLRGLNYSSPFREEVREHRSIHLLPKDELARSIVFPNRVRSWRRFKHRALKYFHTIPVECDGRAGIQGNALAENYRFAAYCTLIR